MSDLPEFHTERLYLRPRSLADIDALVAMDGDPEVMRYVGDGSVRDAASQRVVLTEWLSGTLPSGLGAWSVFPRDAKDDLLGTTFLVPLPDTDLVEIGWRYRRNVWGRGYATEAAAAVLNYGFTTLALDEIVAVVYLENIRSIRVMEKLGLTSAGTCFAYGRDLPIFRMKRPSCA